jgi:hypothetical protein
VIFSLVKPGGTGLVNLTTSASLCDLVRFYRTELRRRGWALTSELAKAITGPAGEENLAFHRDDRVGLLTVERGDEPGTLRATLIIRKR